VTTKPTFDDDLVEILAKYELARVDSIPWDMQVPEKRAEYIKQVQHLARAIKTAINDNLPEKQQAYKQLSSVEDMTDMAALGYNLAIDDFSQRLGIEGSDSDE